MSGFVPEAGDTVSSPREGVTEKGSEGLSPELEERHPRRDRSAPRGGGRVKSGGGESGQLRGRAGPEEEEEEKEARLTCKYLAW